jgi:signal transduction histidine kinase
MNGTLIKPEIIETDESVSQSELTADLLFTISLDLYKGGMITDNAREIFDSLASPPAIFLAARGEEYIHPAVRYAIPIELLRETIAPQTAGIFCRKTGHNRLIGDRNAQICASIIGKDINGHEITAGVLYPSGMISHAIEEEYYAVLSKFRRFYESFSKSRAVGDFLNNDGTRKFVVDTKSGKLIADNRDRYRFRNQNRSPESEYAVTEFIDLIINQKFRTDSDLALDPRLKNIKITRFNLDSYELALVSFNVKVTGSDTEIDFGKLISAFVHKANNKLGALQTAANQLMLEKGQIVDDDEITLANVIHKESEAMGKIVSRLEQYYRIGKPEISTIDLNELMAEVIHIRRNNQPDCPIIHFTPLENQLLVSGDSEQLKIAFSELLENATVFGKAVSVETKNRNNPEVTIYNDLSGSQWQEIRRGTFDVMAPFSTLDQARSGMGLTIARRIIAGHEGNIEIGYESRPGFQASVTLPTMKRETVRD